jgi:hypothetical protein
LKTKQLTNAAPARTVRVVSRALAPTPLRYMPTGAITANIEGIELGIKPPDGIASDAVLTVSRAYGPDFVRQLKENFPPTGPTPSEMRHIFERVLARAEAIMNGPNTHNEAARASVRGMVELIRTIAIGVLAQDEDGPHG